jgi:sRNA-binding protein
MALNVGNYTQQAVVNPFQQRSEEARAPEQKKPQENRTQPREAAAAGAQETETRNERRAESTRSDERSEEPRDARRGSNVDITV